MRVISVASQKGGVGKTTTALNLGYCLSRFGSRVLLVDADPQGSIGIASNLGKRTSKGLVQLLQEECRPKEVVVLSRQRTLAILGVGVTSPEDAIALENAAHEGTLQTTLRDLASHFDYTFVDAPAGVGIISRALLEASHGVLVTIRCQNLQLKSLPIFLKLIQQVREGSNPDLILEGVLVAMKDDRNPTEEELYQEFLEILPETVFFRTQISYDDACEQASMKAVPLALLPGTHKAAKQYLDLAFEFRERELQRLRRTGTGEESLDGLF